MEGNLSNALSFGELSGQWNTVLWSAFRLQERPRDSQKQMYKTYKDTNKIADISAFFAGVGLVL